MSERRLGGFSEAGHAEAVSFAIAAGLFALFVAFCLRVCYVMRSPRGNEQMNTLGDNILKGSKSFLRVLYKYLGLFLFAIYVTLIILFSIDSPSSDQSDGLRIGGCFLAGAILSAIATSAGVSIAADANVRTAQAAEQEGPGKALSVAYTAGSVLSFTVAGLGLSGISILYVIMTLGRPDSSVAVQSNYAMVALVGFGLGASSTSVFTRFAGGIYSKGAELSASLLSLETGGKNPALIADKVGEGIMGVGGAGADYFESLVVSILAAATLAGGDIVLLSLTFWVAASGVVASMVGFFFAGAPEDGSKTDLLYGLYKGKMVAGVLIITLTVIIVRLFFDNSGEGYAALCCIIIGQVYGALIGVVTEYFTSHNSAVETINKASNFSSPMHLIKALGIGMLSVIVPAVIIVASTLGCLYLSGLYGVAIASVSVISNLGINLACDSFGSIANNAVAIVDEAGEGDAMEAVGVLDGAGSAVLATGKGFAMGASVISAISAVLAYEYNVGIAVLNINTPPVIGGLLVGATLPYVFSSLVFLSVQKAAGAILVDARSQINGESYGDGCTKVANNVSLQEMALPGLYAAMAPLIVGILVGPQALAAMLVGVIASGFLLGSALSNSGSALTNATKYTANRTATVGSTIGSVFKDASGPALATLMKLMAMVALTISPLMTGWTEWGEWYFGFIPFGVCVVGTLLVYIGFWKNADEVAPPEVMGA